MAIHQGLLKLMFRTHRRCTPIKEYSFRANQRNSVKQELFRQSALRLATCCPCLIMDVHLVFSCVGGTITSTGEVFSDLLELPIVTPEVGSGAISRFPPLSSGENN